MTRIIKRMVYSLKPEEYPDEEIEFEEYESVKDIIAHATVGETVYAKKKEPIKIRYAQVGEEVDLSPRMSFKGRVYSLGGKSVVKSDTTIVKIPVVNFHDEPVLDEDGNPIIKDVSTKLFVVTDKSGRQYLETEYFIRKRYHINAVVLSYNDQIIVPKGEIVVGFKELSKNVAIKINGETVFATKGGYVSLSQDEARVVSDQTMKALYTATSSNKNFAD